MRLLLIVVVTFSLGGWLGMVLACAWLPDILARMDNATIRDVLVRAAAIRSKRG